MGVSISHKAMTRGRTEGGWGRGGGRTGRAGRAGRAGRRPTGPGLIVPGPRGRRSVSVVGASPGSSQSLSPASRVAPIERPPRALCGALLGALPSFRRPWRPYQAPPCALYMLSPARIYIYSSFRPRAV